MNKSYIKVGQNPRPKSSKPSFKRNESKYMTITIKGEDLDCVNKTITVINNCIYEECGIISEYNVELLNALLGDKWTERYELGKRYIRED